MDLNTRAQRHAALGDERRLRIVDELVAGDRTVAELADLVGMKGNLLAHHLDVLGRSGLIERRVSEGDQRRRYVTLRRDGWPATTSPANAPTGDVVFVCTRNSARSQFAAALWQQATGAAAYSAGSDPADVVHPSAVKVAAEHGLDLSEAAPVGYDVLPPHPELLISVCDRAGEATVPDASRRLHWSVPDPVPVGTLRAFRSSFDEIASRIEHLTGSTS